MYDDIEYTSYNEELHSFGDKPAMQSDNKKEWRKHGVLHRRGGPAWIIKDSDGEKIFEWYKNGKLHRRDGPAIESYMDDRLEQEEWYINDVRTPPGPDLPLRIDYSYSKGEKYISAEYFKKEFDKISRIWWYKPLNGKPCKRMESWDNGRKNDLPTYIMYYKNGNVWVKEWFKNKMRHRKGGKPSYILYDQKGNVTNKKYFENGHEIKKK